MNEQHLAPTAHRMRPVVLASALLTAMTIAVPTAAQDLDICGCEDMPSLGAFHICNSSTYPSGTTVSGQYVDIPLPPDGILVFDSFYTGNCRFGDDLVRFKRNAANTPVTLLVKGEVRLDSGSGIDVRGGAGGNGHSGTNGDGGGPGPGGYRGGDGGHVASVGTASGGAGLGATGGAPGDVSPLTNGGDGQFFGADTALPLTGGTGGGGGAGSETGSTNCSGGGGGGGGGAILIASNYRIYNNNGKILADGGGAGNRGSTCSSYGGRGSGGTIRLVAPRVLGSGYLWARGGASGGVTGVGSNNGLIRIESFNDSHTTSTSTVVPTALRTRVISPLVNPVASTVAITEIDGQPVPVPPRGNIGLIDLLVDAPGLITLRVDTQGVPGGTTVEVAVKPDVGGDAARSEITLDPVDCDDAGACFGFATFNLVEGAYYAEAAATYRTP